VLVELEPSDPSATLLSLIAGVAVIEALAATPPHYSATLKWPNDIVLKDAKAGGILLERQGSRIVVGFGINLAAAPDVPGRKTASFTPPIAVAEFAPMLAGAFGNLFRRWRSGEPQDWLISAWQACAHPVGTPLSVHVSAGDKVSGRFAGIEADGALRLQTASGLQIVRAGDVEL
jgi:BirA family biotin operon repressor/biotin-[acetyl-CoA-carboxylase] ligase